MSAAIRWCQKCILPDTRPGLIIEKDGICNACHNAQAKRVEIDWPARRKLFTKVVAQAKSHRARWDCVVPVSGGKDSFWQVATCLEHGLRVLGITWRPPARTPLGEKNLAALKCLGIEHIDFALEPALERKFMLQALIKAGDPSIPMHLAIFALPLQVAVAHHIPLVVWGENSAFEYGGGRAGRVGMELTPEWIRAHGATGGTLAEDWVSEEISMEELHAYQVPTTLSQAASHSFFLGYFFPWDPEQSLAVARRHGFEAASQPKVGYYSYADIDDDFIAVHHFIKWLKFGFTRLFDNLSLEIRAGRITRSQALEIVRVTGPQIPHEEITAFCAFTEIPVKEFWRIAQRWRNLAIWQRIQGCWQIKDFILPHVPWEQWEVPSYASQTAAVR